MAPNQLLAFMYGLSMLQASFAWLPLTAPSASTALAPAAAAATRPRLSREARHEQLQPTQLRAAFDEGGGGGERPDLVPMKRAFEGTMDNKLVMEYVMGEVPLRLAFLASSRNHPHKDKKSVRYDSSTLPTPHPSKKRLLPLWHALQELRARKALLMSSLQSSGGVITDEIYSIMEELALVNPSSGCGTGKDSGKSHYCAMLPAYASKPTKKKSAHLYCVKSGHWIAASTIVPNVPFVYGQGEKASPPSRGDDGPTCTLGQLVSAISGNPVSSGGTAAAAVEYNTDTPVRPLRARISALNNTVKDGEMPTVVAVAGFTPAAEPRPVEQGEAIAEAAAAAAAAAAGGRAEEDSDEEKDAKAKALAAAFVEAAAKAPRAAAAAGGAGVRAEGFGRAADTITEDGTVKGRGKWGVKGGYNLRWEFETLNIDLGRDRILKAHGGGDEGAWDGGRDLYEFFLDQNMLIVAWKDDPKKEDAVVFVRDEVSR
ncbi:unnamed protein product [Pylaiella littoralis]